MIANGHWRFVVLGAVGLGCGCASGDTQIQPSPREVASRPDPSAAFLKLADDHAARILQTAPEWATQLGVSETIGGKFYRRGLSDYSVAGNRALVALNQMLLKELEMVDRSELTGTALVTFDVMKAAYGLAARQNTQGVGYASLLGVNPPYAIDQLFGAHVSLTRFFAGQIPVTNAAELDDYMARLALLSGAIDDVATVVRDDAKRGVLPPRFALEAVRDSLRRLADGSIEKNPIVSSIVDRVASLEDLTAERRRDAGAKVRMLVQRNVQPALGNLAATVEQLISESGNEAGIWRLKNGSELYQIALDNYGANGLTADEIHSIGRRDVERILDEMDGYLRTQGLRKGTVGDRMRSLAARSDVQFENSDHGRAEAMKTLETHVANIMAVAPDWFGHIPPQALEVRRIPPHEQDTASGAYYTPPSLDGKQPGIFWINLKDTADWPAYSLESLVYHEAVPGHHFQASSQLAIDDLPLIRKMMWFADYGEGWALYTEALAVEMGMYDNDPLGHLGRLRMELYRAARLVVDTGLHKKRWTRDRAIDWMTEVTGEPRSAIEREIDRYAVWPGQATSYKLGMIQFQRFRAKAERALGTQFDVRAFHDFVLAGGAMPMQVLEAQLDRWIAEQPSNGAPMPSSALRR